MSVALFVIILQKDERESCAELVQDELLHKVCEETKDESVSNINNEQDLADDKTVAAETINEVDNDAVQADAYDNDNLINIQSQKINVSTPQERSVADEFDETVSTLGTKNEISDGSKPISNNESKTNNEDTINRTEIMTPPPTDDFIEKVPILDVLRSTLRVLNIADYAVTATADHCKHQVTFIEDVNRGNRIEEIIHKLHSNGIGSYTAGTSISIFNGSIFIEAKEATQMEENLQTTSDFNESAEEIGFRESIKSRLVVNQVVASIESNAKLTFDYIMLIVLASIIAALGLVENSPVVLVASMLISPLMGPIMAATFGLVIQRNSLRNIGLKSEMIGLLLCLICGFAAGLVIALCHINGTSLWHSTDEWPTNEMKSRGMLRSLWVGVLIAVPSGAGVALSVLGGNIGSLVGVAISASLLPPAVNAGMLWAIAIVSAIDPPSLLSVPGKASNITYFENATHIDNSTQINRTVIPESGLHCPPLSDNEYVPMYYCDVSLETGYMGLISLVLTLLNILCIFIMGIAILKLKGVMPHGTTSDDTDAFFSHDIKIFAKSMQTTKGPESASLARQIKEEYMKICEAKQEDSDDVISVKLKEARLKSILQNIENDDTVKQQLSRVSARGLPRSISSQFDDLRISEGTIDNRGNVTYKRSFSSGNYKTISHVQFDESSPLCSTSRSNLFFRSKSMHENKSLSSPAIVIKDKKEAAAKKSTGRFTVRPAQLVRFEITKIPEASSIEQQKQHSTEEPSGSVSDPLLL